MSRCGRRFLLCGTRRRTARGGGSSTRKIGKRCIGSVHRDNPVTLVQVDGALMPPAINLTAAHLAKVWLAGITAVHIGWSDIPGQEFHLVYLEQLQLCPWSLPKQQEQLRLSRNTHQDQSAEWRVRDLYSFQRPSDQELLGTTR